MRWPDREAGPWSLRVSWRELDGRLECTGLAIEPADASVPVTLTSTVLRGLPLGRIVDELWGTRANILAEAAGKPRVGSADHKYEPVFSTQKQTVPHVGRPPVYGDAHYELVAEVYIAAFKDRLSPVKAVSSRFEVPHTTAAKWVSTCRRRGLLPATKPGLARVTEANS